MVFKPNTSIAHEVDAQRVCRQRSAELTFATKKLRRFIPEEASRQNTGCESQQRTHRPSHMSEKQAPQGEG